MTEIQENYIHKWLLSLLKRVGESGLDRITLETAWQRALHPTVDGMMMVDPFLHTFSEAALFEVAKKYFDISGDSLLVPDESVMAKRQEVILPTQPFTNRQKIAQRLADTCLIQYYDPYMCAAWLTQFNQVYQMITPNIVQEIQFLTSNRNITGATKRKAFIELAEAFAQENGAQVTIRIVKKEHPRFFLANGRVWKVGHSIKDLDQFENLDEQIEQRSAWKDFWSDSWAGGVAP